MASLYNYFKLIGLLIFILSYSICGATEQSLRFLYMAQSGYQPPDILKRTAEFTKRTKIHVNTEFVEYDHLYQSIIHGSDINEDPIDVLLVDLIWIADFADRGLITVLPKELKQNLKHEIVPEILNAFIYKNNLWAHPFLADFQLLYVNQRLLRAAGINHLPQSLEELTWMAEQVKDKGLLKYPIFDSWQMQEVLICDFVIFTGAYGGKLINEKGEIDVTSNPAIEALNYMVGLIKKGLMNPYSLEQDELFSNDVFLNEDSLFTTNWTFLTGIIRKSNLPISDYGVPTLIPVSETLLASSKTKTTSVSGFGGLAILSKSRNKAAALKLIKFLAAKEFQKRHLDELPVWKKIWDAPTTFKKDPLIGLKKEQISGVNHRPIHQQYLNISRTLRYWITEALQQNVSPQQALRQAQKDIDKICGK